jgi:WD40 repeat protein
LAFALEDKLQLWNINTADTAWELVVGQLGDTVFGVEFSPDGAHVASVSDQTVRLWNVQTGKKGQSFSHTGRARCVAFSPDGTHIASGSEDAKVRIWNAKTGDTKQEFLLPSEEVWSSSTMEIERFLLHNTGSVRMVAFAPDGTRIMSGSQDNLVRI